MAPRSTEAEEAMVKASKERAERRVGFIGLCGFRITIVSIATSMPTALGFLSIFVRSGSYLPQHEVYTRIAMPALRRENKRPKSVRNGCLS